MKYWAKAVWIHVSEAVSTFLAAAVLVVIMLLGTLVAGCAIGFVGWLVASLFGPVGLLIAVLAVVGAAAIFFAIWALHGAYLMVKDTKEALEREENYETEAADEE